ncbi:MAG: tRNA dihydrouridine synthase DusB [Clostridiaceae bacterium]|nr:tRNA dihydrouridine synthase DusB [Clostridiaceae bacterium]
MRFCSNIDVENRFFLAPMAGVTDAAFRTVCESLGASLTYTEMVSAKALTYRDEKSSSMLILPEGRKPCFAQIFGSEPDVMAEGARYALEVSGAEGIDINMGCPVSKIVGNCEGSALMKAPDRAEAIIKAVIRAVDVPVTVKFRKGYESGSFTCIEFAKMAEQAGVSAMCIHGRTRAQMYSGLSDREAIAGVKSAVSVPVIASGDALTARDCLDILDETGADFVMIARGAQGNPFIFDDCVRMDNGLAPNERSLEQVLEIIERHARMLCLQKGEKKAMLEFRKHGLWYLGRLCRVKPFKLKMSGLSSMDQLLEICGEMKAVRPDVKEG